MTWLQAHRVRYGYSVSEMAERLQVSAAEYELAERGHKVLAGTRLALEIRFGRPLCDLQHDPSVTKRGRPVDDLAAVQHG